MAWTERGLWWASEAKMPPVTSSSLIYNSFTSLPDISCMWASARSSWIYLDMDQTVKKGVSEDSASSINNSCGLDDDDDDDDVDVVSAASTCATSVCFSTSTRTSTLTSTLGRSGLTFTLRSSSASFAQTRKSSQGGDRGGCVRSQAFAVVCDTAAQLWKDNPERDFYNTFSVSEHDLTQAIAHLETQLGCHGHPLPAVPDQLLEDGVMPELAPEERDKDLPFRIRFILDSYCNIFMLR